jgi:hypothetical protein
LLFADKHPVEKIVQPDVCLLEPNQVRALTVSLTRESTRSIWTSDQASFLESFLSPPNSTGVKLSGND